MMIGKQVIQATTTSTNNKHNDKICRTYMKVGPKIASSKIVTKNEAPPLIEFPSPRSNQLLFPVQLLHEATQRNGLDLIETYSAFKYINLNVSFTTRVNDYVKQSIPSTVLHQFHAYFDIHLLISNITNSTHTYTTQQEFIQRDDINA